jgi:protein-disulfide isomerase
MPEMKRAGGLLDAPPKTTFLLGLFAGIAATAVVFLLVGTPGSAADSKVKGTAAANLNTNTAQPSAPAGDATKITQPTKDDHYRGADPAKAKVTLVTYTDFQCPFCDQLHPTLQRIVDENPDTISWVYRDYPLTSIHPQAQSAANAAECASEQDKFWEYADALFAKQAQLADGLYATIASDLGLNEKKFNECYSSKKYQDDITAQSSEGDSAGVTGTPATFVLKGNDLASGQLISGALPYDTFKSVIDGLL